MNGPNRVPITERAQQFPNEPLLGRATHGALWPIWPQSQYPLTPISCGGSDGLFPSDLNPNTIVSKQEQCVGTDLFLDYKPILGLQTHSQPILLGLQARGSTTWPPALTGKRFLHELGCHESYGARMAHFCRAFYQNETK